MALEQQALTKEPTPCTVHSVLAGVLAEEYLRALELGLCGMMPYDSIILYVHATWST